MVMIGTVMTPRRLGGIISSEKLVINGVGRYKMESGRLLNH